MDIQLQELIDKIKRDGIETATTEAAKLKAQAETDAAGIVEAARKDAQEILRQAREGAKREEAAGIAAVQQASRNLVLAFQGEIQALLDAIVKKTVAAAYTDDVLSSVIPQVITGWAKGSDSLALILSEDAGKRLSDFFNEKLAAELSKGLVLKSDRNLAGGFRIGQKDGSAYYDFSAEAVANLFSAYLNPRLGEALKNAVKGS